MSWNQQQNQWGTGSGWGQSGQPAGAPGQYQRPGAPPPAQYQQGYAPQSQAFQNPGQFQTPGAPGVPATAPPPGVSVDVWHMFLAVDQDGSRQITAQELQRALMNGNWTQFNPETCRLMIGMFDRDGNGTINVHEFQALWQYIHEWRSCFDRFDTDRSGRINAQELAQAFSQFGYRLSENFSRMCILKFDRERRNEIQFDDFIQCCVMLRSLTEAFKQRDTNKNGVIRIGYEQFLEMVLENRLS